MYVLCAISHLIHGLWRHNVKRMPLDHKRDRHLMYPIVCDCTHSSDEEGEDEIYQFSPPLNVEDMPCFIIKPRKWTDWVH